MELVERLDAARERWNVLRHPFYRRWSEGRLTREELAFYAGQYRHAVVALSAAAGAAARAADPALRPELERHAAEERAHVDVWDDFADAVGAEPDRPPLEETRQCTAAWTAGRNLVERLAVLYAVEAGQPAVSRTKLDGLTSHYGIASDDPGAAYFVLHAERDREHAAHSRALIEELADTADHEPVVNLAERAVQGNWRLLDGVEAAPMGAA